MKSKKILFVAIVVIALLSVLCMQSFAAGNVAGDFNDDGTLNSADAIYLLNHYFEPEEYPVTNSGVDTNGDGSFNSADAIYLLNHYFEPEEYPIGCSHELEYHEAIYPTCTEDGNAEYWSCSKCGKNYAEEEATTELASVVVNASHDWVGIVSNGDGTHSATCSVCGESEDAKACYGGEATCTAKAVCSVCDREYGPEPAHAWGDGVVTTSAGCESTGIRTYTCSVCEDTKTENIAATGHNYDSAVVAPTCLCLTSVTFVNACIFTIFSIYKIVFGRYAVIVMT